MRFYIATRLENVRGHNFVRDALIARGHAITYDWSTHGPVYRDGLARIREVSHLELDGVVRADLVIVLLPGGRGTHAELGMALACDVPVLLAAPPDVARDSFGAAPETCAFYHHPLVTPHVRPAAAPEYDAPDLAVVAENVLSSYLAREGAQEPSEGVARIAAERQRQLRKLGWTKEHDQAEHWDGRLARQAAGLLLDPWPADVPGALRELIDPWQLARQHRGDRVRQLTIAGALIAAELDRLLGQDGQ